MGDNTPFTSSSKALGVISVLFAKDKKVDALPNTKAPVAKSINAPDSVPVGMFLFDDRVKMLLGIADNPDAEGVPCKLPP